MLQSPRDLVVGASDLEGTAAFLDVFGFTEVARAQLPAAAAQALYGLDGPAEMLLMEMPGAERGRIRVVATPNPAPAYAPFDNRPFAIDLFSSDIEKSVALATDEGFHSSPITDHHFGPVVIREVEVKGPDGLIMTLLEPSAGRRPSILDDDPDRLHSEVHAFVWSAKEVDELLPYWLDHGFETIMDAVLDTPGLGALVGMPDEELTMRLTVFADDAVRAIRLEFVDFQGKPAADHPTMPLGAGLHAPAFEVADLDRALEELAPAEFGEPVSVDNAIHGTARAATAVAPGGLRFEIWQVG